MVQFIPGAILKALDRTGEAIDVVNERVANDDDGDAETKERVIPVPVGRRSRARGCIQIDVGRKRGTKIRRNTIQAQNECGASWKLKLIRKGPILRVFPASSAPRSFLFARSLSRRSCLHVIL